MMRTWMRRARAAAVAGLGSAALSGCLNDPAWQGVAMGLNMAADEIAAENAYRAQCHPRSLGACRGEQRYPDMLCPGDYGYDAAFVTFRLCAAAARSSARRDHRDRRDDRRR